MQNLNISETKASIKGLSTSHNAEQIGSKLGNRERRSCRLRHEEKRATETQGRTKVRPYPGGAAEHPETEVGCSRGSTGKLDG